jgi:hypothetical protein
VPAPQKSSDRRAREACFDFDFGGDTFPSALLGTFGDYVQWRSHMDGKLKGPIAEYATGPFLFLILAATYVPTQLPVQYHRPYGA